MGGDSFGGMIMLHHALEMMHKKDHKGKPVPFSVEVCTADRRKQTGGDLLELKGVILTFSSAKEAKRTLNEEKRAKAQKAHKGAFHRRNRTRNFLLPNGQIRKAHISLITLFNGEVVI